MCVPQIILQTLLLVLLSLNWHDVHAAVPQIPRFRIIDAGEGLPSSMITGLAQDRAGYLWLATGDGLARYDGTGFKVWRHDPADPESLAANSLQALHIDAQDRIWVASESAGISVLDAERRHFRHYRSATQPEMSNDDVFVLAGRGDEVWFGNYGGDVHRIAADGRFQRFDLSAMEDGLPRSHVLALAADEEGRIWVGTPEGLAWFDGQRMHREYLPEHNAGIYSLISTGGKLWAASESGIYWREPDGSWHMPDWSPMFAAGNVLWTVVDAGDGEFWLGSEKGLWRTRGAQPPMPVLDGNVPLVSGRNVQALLRGSDGGLWVPIHGRGLAYLRDDWKRTAMLRPLHNHGDGVYCGLALAAHWGGLWQTDTAGNLLRLDISSGETTLTGWQRDEFKGMQLTAGLEDSHGRLWLGNLDNGLDRIDLGNGSLRSWSREGADPLPAYGAPDWLLEAADGSIWLSALGVLQRRDGDTGRVLDSVSASSGHGLLSTDVEQLANGPDGRVWVAGAGGIQAWHADMRRFVSIAELQGERIYSFAFTVAEQLWTHRLQGLQQWQREGEGWKLRREVGPEQGLPVLESMGMQIDSAGRIWLSSRRGLWRIDIAGSRPQIHHYGLRDGFTSQEFIDGCLFMARDGVLVGGAADGHIAMLDTRMPDAAPFTPQLMTETVSVLRDGRRIELPVTGGFQLQAGDRQLQASMRLLSFGEPLSNRYQSWLYGFDTDWVEQGTVGVREFSSLQAGDYVLNMQGIDRSGNFSKVRELHFSVAPPWWRTAWGAALLLMLTVLLLATAVALYQRKLRRRNAWQLAQHKRELAEQASQAKTRFLATLGHEVRTPMTGVLGMSELLLQTPLDQRQHGYVSSIEAAGKHLLRLVNDALDLARIEAGKLPLENREFELDLVLQQVVALVRPMAEGKGLVFELRTDAGLPRSLRGDVNRLQQVLLNLLANAIKFTEYGSIVLEARLPRESAPERGIRFEVTDTGPGIADEQRERLFQRFEQGEGAKTTARYGGSGLGLAICRELTHAMGGRIEVSSRLGHGTSFRVELPLPWSSLPVPLPRVSEILPGRTLRLLLVEDDPTVAEVVAGLLRMRGHQVTHAAHGLAALTEVSAAAFDAGLFDLDLPGLDGFELARQLRSLGYRYPLVAVTARSDAEVEPQALAAGFDGFLRKPLTGEMLEQALARALMAELKSDQ